MTREEYFKNIDHKIKEKKLEKEKKTACWNTSTEIALEFSRKLKDIVFSYGDFYKAHGYFYRNIISDNTPDFTTEIRGFPFTFSLKIGISKSLVEDCYEVFTYHNGERTNNDIIISDNFDSEKIEQELQKIFSVLV